MNFWALQNGGGVISTEDFTDETLVINDTCGGDVREIVVLIMEVYEDDEVTDMEIEK